MPSSSSVHSNLQRDLQKVQLEHLLTRVESITSDVWQTRSRTRPGEVPVKMMEPVANPVSSNSTPMSGSGGMISPLNADSDIPMIRKAWSVMSSQSQNEAKQDDTKQEKEPDGEGNDPDESPPESEIANCDMYNMEMNDDELDEALSREVSKYSALPQEKQASILKIPIDGAIFIQNQKQAEQELKKLQNAIDLCEKEIKGYEAAKEDFNRPYSRRVTVHIPDNMTCKTEKIQFVNNMMTALKYQLNILNMKKLRVQRVIQHMKGEPKKPKKRMGENLISRKEMQQKIHALQDDSSDKEDKDRKMKREDAKRLPSIQKSAHRSYKKSTKPVPTVPSFEMWHLRSSHNTMSKRDISPCSSDQEICALYEQEKQINFEYYELQRKLHSFEEERRRLDLGCQEREAIGGISYPPEIVTLKEKSRYVRYKLAKYKKQKHDLITEREEVKEKRKELERIKQKDLIKPKLDDKKSFPKLNREKENNNRQNLSFKQKIISGSMVSMPDSKVAATRFGPPALYNSALENLCQGVSPSAVKSAKAQREKDPEKDKARRERLKETVANEWLSFDGAR